MGRCGECKFWGKNIPIYPGAHEREDQAGEWRQCGRVAQGDSYDPEQTRHELAVVIDGSNYYAAIKSRSDFGCVLFEAKND